MYVAFDPLQLGSLPEQVGPGQADIALQVKIVTKDTVGSSGTLTLNIADSLTGKSDALKCSLV